MTSSTTRAIPAVTCRDNVAAYVTCSVLFEPGTWTTGGSTMALAATLKRGGVTYATAAVT